MSSQNKKLVDAIGTHCWNGKKSKLALSPADNSIMIFGSSLSVKEATTLTEHDLTVTAIDWSPKTNRILSCGQDRNAFVWSESKSGTWKPTLVLLRINRAATCARWSPKENKFAVGNGARCIAVCYFESENDWWVSKHIKKPIKSTVLSVDWHPNNIVLACGSSDFKCRLFSAFIKGIDKKDQATNPFTQNSNFSFGECLGEFEATGGWGPSWVHSVSFSPSGNTMVFVGHDSTINFVHRNKTQTIRTHHLPYLQVLFLNEHSVVAAGHDCAPYHYVEDGGNWKLKGSLDKGAGSNGLKVPAPNASSSSAWDATPLSTSHQGTITCMRGLKDSSGNIKEFTTSGVDGRLCTWKK